MKTNKNISKRSYTVVGFENGNYFKVEYSIVYFDNQNKAGCI